MATKPTSSPMKRFSRILRSKFLNHSPPGVTYLSAILGATDKKEDLWMMTDFTVLRELLRVPSECSSWFCCLPVSHDKYLLGDPACDRIEFNPPPSFETVSKSPAALKADFLRDVARKVAAMAEGDTLVIVLVGHGSETRGEFIVGDVDDGIKLMREEVDAFVSDAKGKIWLISTACFSGFWSSPNWWLLAAAEKNQSSVSLVISGSDKARGGFFVNALLAQHANEHGLDTPCPGTPDDSGIRPPQHPHDFGPLKSVEPSCPAQNRSLRQVCDWIHNWRGKIGRTSGYPDADITFVPCPFLALQSADQFHRFICLPPSPPGNDLSHISGNTVTHRISPLIAPTLTWSCAEDKELLEEAQRYLGFKPLQIAPDIGTILRCAELVHGKPVADEEKSSLLANLQNRRACQALALAIARCLGWDSAIDNLGIPEVEQGSHGAGTNWRSQAEQNGCLTQVVTRRPPGPKQRVYLGAGGWLSRVWDAAGRPVVPSGEWEQAVKRSLCQVSQTYPGNM